MSIKPRKIKMLVEKLLGGRKLSQNFVATNLQVCKRVYYKLPCVVCVEVCDSSLII